MADDRNQRMEIERVATVLGLGAVLLPVAGYITRLLAFTLGLDIDNRGALALAASLGTLSVTGFYALLNSLPYLVGLLIFVRGMPLMAALKMARSSLSRIVADSERFDADVEEVKRDLAVLIERGNRNELVAEAVQELHRRVDVLKARGDQLVAEREAFFASDEYRLIEPRLKDRPGGLSRRLASLLGRVPNWLFSASGVLVWSVSFVFFTDWPYGIFGLLGWIVAVLIVPWFLRRSGQVTLWGLAVAVGSLLLLASVQAGFSGDISGEYVADYTFKPDATLPSGPYIHLGETDGFMYLQACGSHRVLGISTDRIDSFAAVRLRPIPRGPTLWSILRDRHDPILGYRPEC